MPRFRFLRRSILFLPPVLGSVLAGCVAYDADDSTAASVAAAAGRRTGGAFPWPAAIAAALEHNPELRALAAEARATGAVSQPFDLEVEYRGEPEMMAALVDPTALVGLGVRGASTEAAHAAAAAAVERLAVARWRTIAAVVEIFAIDAALAAIPIATVDVDAGAFERAGVASRLACAQLRAARARLAAEASEIGAERARNRARLRELLGLPPGVPCEPIGDAPPIDQPAATEAAVLRRPDLAVATAELRLADAEFRRAVAEQYPTLRLGPEVPLRGGPTDVLAMLRLPLATTGLAVAARERRDGARERLLGAWLAASNEAAAADAALAAARQVDDAATAAFAASRQALEIGAVAVRVETDAFDRLADAATMTARDAMERRVATVARVRAEVARAVAFGWPAHLGSTGSEVAAHGGRP